MQRLRVSSDQSDTDYDGLLMLGVSVSVILFSAGLSWLWHAHKVWRYAIFTTAAPNSALESDKMLVFGKRLNANKPDADFQSRLRRAVTLCQQNNVQYMFLLGGAIKPNVISEARAGWRWLQNQLPPHVNVVLEERSRNTLENLRNIRSDLRQRNLALEVVLVSSRYHLYRCLLISQGLGFKVHLVAAEPNLSCQLNVYRKIASEAFLSHWYNTGFFVSKLLKRRRILAKIQ